MAAIDTAGDPIYYLITETNLIGVPRSVVFGVYDQVKEAVDNYYEANTYRGCTHRESPNFNFRANVEDGSCHPPSTKYEFGGVYQLCEGSGPEHLCTGLSQKNPVTGAFTCPNGYTDITMETLSKQSILSKHECHHCLRKYKCCKNKILNSTATYTAHWCAGSNNATPNKGLLFGGMFTSKRQNAVTQNYNCPQYFYPVKLLNMNICLSDDYELASHWSLPFGGFYSCNSGNPWVSDQVKRVKGQHLLALRMSNHVPVHSCPTGFSQHHATMAEGCAVNVCVQAGALSAQTVTTIQRPPFIEVPRQSENIQDSAVIVIVDAAGGTFMEIGESESKQVMNVSFQPESNEGDDEKQGFSGLTVTLIAVGAAAAACVLAAVSVVLIQRWRLNRDS